MQVTFREHIGYTSAQLQHDNTIKKFLRQMSSDIDVIATANGGAS
jgi:hypothetical protein